MPLKPDIKILSPLVSIYTLCLFLPTIDAVSICTLKWGDINLQFALPALIFPLVYPLADCLTEVYGKKVSYYVTWSCYFFIVFFSLINNGLLLLCDNEKYYAFIVKQSTLLTLIGPIGFFITSALNIKFLSELKLRLRGRHFLIRSFICSGISDLILSLIVLPVVFYDSQTTFLFKLWLGTVFIKIIVTIPYVFLAKMLVIFMRRIEGIQLELYSANFMQKNCENG